MIMHTATCKFVVVSACGQDLIIETMLWSVHAPACNILPFYHVMLFIFQFYAFFALLLLIIVSNEGHSMKLMPELESLRFIYPIKCFCALLYAAYPDFRLC